MNMIAKEKMEIAINKHKSGNYVEAKSLYEEVLNFSPGNSYANHNLGSILVKNHSSQKALPFLAKALEINSEVEQFWVSYIDALINLNDLDSAKKILDLALKKGISENIYINLLERTLSPKLQYKKGNFFRALDGDYLSFLEALHQNIYLGYFEIGTQSGRSLSLSKSPSVAIDPYFVLNKDPIGNKEFCFLFQSTSDSFFEKILPQLQFLQCQLAFIDGMHLFEYALRDFINLVKISADKSLFLFHDILPFSYRMATRDYKSLNRNEDCAGDVWKLAHILIEIGMKDCMKILTSAPTGLLAVYCPDKKLVAKLEKNYDKICSKWTSIVLDSKNLEKLYETNLFIKPEIYLQFLKKMNFGENKKLLRDVTMLDNGLVTNL